MPSRRTTSYSTGRTRRSRDTPMFFIARMVAAMFTGSCGSYSTTTTDDSSDSGIDQIQANEPRPILSIAAQVHEFSSGTAQDELPPAPNAPARHLVHRDVDLDRSVARQRDVEQVSAVASQPAYERR